MSDTATAHHPEPLTLEKVYRELQVLRERVEDLEDPHDLSEAIAENAGKPFFSSFALGKRSHQEVGSRGHNHNHRLQPV
jgi:hypothetical protein